MVERDGCAGSATKAQSVDTPVGTSETSPRQASSPASTLETRTVAAKPSSSSAVPASRNDLRCAEADRSAAIRLSGVIELEPASA